MRTLALALVLAAGCAGSGEPPPVPCDADPACVGPLEAIVLPADDGDPAGICACPDQACVEAWVAANIGCDLCVHVTCGDGVRSACVACDGD